MNKIKDIEDWKTQFKRKERKALKRKRQKRQIRKALAKKRKSRGKVIKPVKYVHTHIHTGKHYEIDAPSNFSLTSNVEDTLQFFQEVHDCIINHRKIYLNLSNISEITTDSILYMLAQIEYNRYIGNKAQITGNVPDNINCRKLLETSGFFKYIYYQGSLHTDSNMFTIVRDAKVRPVIAKAVKDFSMDRLVLMRSSPRGLYKTLIECMANTRNHAYASQSIYTKWWLMASFNDDLRMIRITFLDNGFSIPKTIRKNLGDYIKQITGFQKDSTLIFSALKGEFRTQTGQSYRGKGLPDIYKHALDNKIENLIIISKNGYVNASQGISKELENSFYGTLLTWDFP